MPADHMFWGTHRYGDGSQVPLKAYRCKSYLAKSVGGVTKATGHKCKKPIDHEGDHGCLCGKTWQRDGKPS